MENTWTVALATKRALATTIMIWKKRITMYRSEQQHTRRPDVAMHVFSFYVDNNDTQRTPEVNAVKSSCGAHRAAPPPARHMPDNADGCWAKQRRAEVNGERRHPPWKRKARNGCSQDPIFKEDIKMLALPGPRVMDRLSHDMAARRDRQVRLHSVQTDLELDLPPNIALPDGEEVPYGSSTRLQIRDNEQESEIYQKCIRPPPNRTVFDGESPPPYRSSSAGVLGSGDPGDWSSGGSSMARVIRCHSVSSGSSSGSTRSTTTPTPAVIVPTRSRRLSAFSDSSGGGGSGGGGGTLANLTMVPCRVEPRRPAKPPHPQRGAV